jgi:hypothetical protein
MSQRRLASGRVWEKVGYEAMWLQCGWNEATMIRMLVNQLVTACYIQGASVQGDDSGRWDWDGADGCPTCEEV